MRPATKLVSIVLVSAALAMLALTGCTTVEASSNPTDSDAVTATGTGKALAPPDTATLTFGPSAKAPTASEALDKVSAAVAEITSATVTTGVAEEDIQTADVSVYPEYAHEEGKEPRVTGYRASIQLRVMVRDIRIVGDVITAATEAGATNMSGPVFSLEDDDAAVDEALRAAVDDARKRAESMAGAADKTVGEVLVLKEQELAVPSWGNALLRMDHGAYAAADSVPVEPGQLDINAQVTVVFRLQ